MTGEAIAGAGDARPADADQALLARAAAGDPAAFDRLVRRHTPRMYRVALRITGAATEAEDVVQDAWIAAWRALPGFRSESAVSTWLFRVVTNTALGHVRRRRPTVSLDAALTPEEDQGRPLLDAGVLADSRGNPEGQVVRTEQVTAVLRAIAELDVSQRVPLVLRELEGLSYEEVAEVLEVSVPALRSRLHRARVALLAKLRELR
ncbi:RNA polymerase sigma-70 factor, ECF subfamily [Amycolatopsis arida]|uniref:RNA polymerase sigma-70 factor, ECF subfamily n=1 Tax=Amycolatopsis arida TaxID=587909 RepID=A0A1I5ZUS6_9PSEU|nr:sigma-70 family RNA polymerase sigma factor [Amycolatopsis arida]TDX89382.1 RNA polymerase sigma-70 factor (ECF subfamily) [Amycolatopsis arida]SFQ60208.1 RNA polymerase sigma-70 factor, ECF subfamily [Amycolatopsis arida]